MKTKKNIKAQLIDTIQLCVLGEDLKWQKKLKKIKLKSGR